jgi:circadian clock protein KaiC
LITGERGDGTLTRRGLEEYVSDCVILLDHRVLDQVSTRRLRIVKYRGTAHGTNEYPFLIDEKGFNVLPLTSVGLEHKVSNERISTGIPRLDTMLGGKGVYRGSTILVSGTAGTGKTSLAGYFVNAACQRGERSLPGTAASELSFDWFGSETVDSQEAARVPLQPGYCVWAGDEPGRHP